MPIQLVASACDRTPPGGSAFERSKTPTLSSPRKPPSKTLFPFSSFRFTHQVKFSISLWKTDSRNPRSTCPMVRRSIWYTRRQAQACTGVHIGERPLVRRELPIRVHVPLAQGQHELQLRELDIHQRHRDAVERQIPRGVQGHPLSGMEDLAVEVTPLAVPHPSAAREAAPGKRESPRSQRSTSKQ